jgi:hypothetical protein
VVTKKPTEIGQLVMISGYGRLFRRVVRWSRPQDGTSVSSVGV